MAFITYGVSTGDYASGLLRAGFEQGILASGEPLITLELFAAYMARADYREVESTPEQWEAAYLRFLEGIQHWHRENPTTAHAHCCTSCGESWDCPDVDTCTTECPYCSESV